MLVYALSSLLFHIIFSVLTVTVSPEPILITESLSFRRESLNSFKSLRVHMEAAAIEGMSSKTPKAESYRMTAKQRA